jgi:hypothetical protein
MITITHGIVKEQNNMKKTSLKFDWHSLEAIKQLQEAMRYLQVTDGQGRAEVNRVISKINDMIEDKCTCTENPSAPSLMGKSTKGLHKFYMLHYTPQEGNVYHYFDTPKQMLEALRSKYMRTLQEATIGAAFCYDEETKTWKGFRYEEAVEYLIFIVEKG